MTPWLQDWPKRTRPPGRGIAAAHSPPALSECHEGGRGAAAAPDDATHRARPRHGVCPLRNGTCMHAGGQAGWLEVRTALRQGLPGLISTALVHTRTGASLRPRPCSGPSASPPSATPRGATCHIMGIGPQDGATYTKHTCRSRLQQSALDCLQHDGRLQTPPGAPKLPTVPRGCLQCWCLGC